MSTLRVSTIQDTAGSNSSTPAAIANGIAKAWVNFNGTGTVAIRAQFNVSSITDLGVGDYRVNFTTAMPDANYAYFAAGMEDNTGAFSGAANAFFKRTAPATGSIRVGFNSLGSGGLDAVQMTVSIFR